MLEDLFEASWALARFRAGCTGPYIDGFATALAKRGYVVATMRGYVRAAAHLGRWADRRKLPVPSWTDDVLPRFRRHLARCVCIKRNKGRFQDAVRGAAHLLEHLRDLGVVPRSAPRETTPAFAPISARFAAWMIRHRGVATTTTDQYQRILRPFLRKLGENPTTYTVKQIRSYIISELTRGERGKARSAVYAIRAFLRHLVAEGRVHAGMEHCVPTVPMWRLATLPRYLDAPDIESVINSCDKTGQGLRDRAILLLLARLGLRAGDVAQMSLRDFDWSRGTVRLAGKGRREVLLPLPQDVGDAVFSYLERARPALDTERVFLSVRAPIRAFATSASVSDVVRAALKRAGIKNPPIRGAHLLRHSAATAMLRAGGSLETIATVLRHRSIESTAHYAKVDLALLVSVVQPWPAGASC